MFRSWHLGRPFGINLFVHWTFWLLPLFALFGESSRDPVFLGLQLALIFSLFGCVILHELGHALTARRFGIGTRSIVLSPIGGVASFDRPMRSAWEEFSIALAGPLVNVAIALGLGGFLVVAARLEPGFLDTIPGEFVFMLLSLNVLMVVFNLLPAFPMDGGRVFRAVLAGWLGLLGATRVAVRVGTIVAAALAFYGVVGIVQPGYPLASPWLLPIAAFVIWAGRAELAQLEARARYRPTRGQRDGEEMPTVTPVRSTAAWPAAAHVVAYVWDDARARWIREERPLPHAPGT